MDTIMELDDMKIAWQSLDARLARHDRLQLELLRGHRLDAARRGLRGLKVGQWLQLALGIMLIVLGVACWTRNLGTPGLFATGVAVHVFGVITSALAALTLGLAATVDYAAPVTTIQRQLARLQRFYAFNANACGAPWWVMWVLVVVAVAGAGNPGATGPTPAWIAWSFWLGIAGTLGTWAWAWHHRDRDGGDLQRDRCDGADGIRRGRRMLEELAQFERE
jgi:hypothetical protein